MFPMLCIPPFAHGARELQLYYVNLLSRVVVILIISFIIIYGVLPRPVGEGSGEGDLFDEPIYRKQS